MPSPLNFIVISALISSIIGSVASFSCITEVNSLNCTVTGETASINTTSFNINTLNQVVIFYSGTVNIALLAPRTNAIVIQSTDPDACLQIQRIETRANRIDVQIALSSSQLTTPVFSASSALDISNATVIVTVKYQSVANIGSFRVFGSSSTATNKFINDYRVIFYPNLAVTSGELKFQNFLNNLIQVSSMTISGTNQSLVTIGSTETYQRVNDLTLRKLYLSDKILESFENVSTLTIEECSYNRNAQFLQASRPFEISLTMKNNIPLDLTLPNNSGAFTGSAVVYTNITIIEPRLNSSCLNAIKLAQNPKTITVEVSGYQKSDFESYITQRPNIWALTIRNLQSLSVIPSRFFAQIDGLRSTVLGGSFKLEKQDICPFVGIPIQTTLNPRIVTLEMTQTNTDDSNACARTYTSAINIRSTSEIQCPDKGTKEDCDKWEKQTKACQLVDYENNCTGNVPPPNVGSRIRFYFNGSYVQKFLDSRSWASATTDPTNSKNDEKLDFRPIIGALVGLLAAITVLTVTIFCIRRLRRKEATKYIPSAPTEKGVPPSSYDTTHLSIATSKTSKSSTRALEKSFFPVQPSDEIAPPLYTAPSEAVASISPYQASAPPGRRDSVLTHATHVYETLDS